MRQLFASFTGATLSCVGIAALVSQPAIGQTAVSSSDDSGLAEIIVTATRREERLQDVPMSITALSGAELQHRGATDISDIIANTPGLTNPSQGLGINNNLIMRGVATGAGSTLAQATVSLMLDEVDLNPGSVTFGTSNPKIIDVAQVEVLRGPQGTLFGAGSLSGVVRYISNKPDLNNFTGSVEVTGESTYHGGASEETTAVLNAPIIDGVFGARIAAYYDNDAGWVDDEVRGIGNVNDTRTYGVRLGLLARPIDELSVSFTAMIDRTHEQGSTASYYFPQPGIPDYKTQQPYYSEGTGRLDTHIFNLTETWTPGFGTLTSSTNYFDRFINGTQDLGAILPVFVGPPTNLLTFAPGVTPSAPSVGPNTVHEISQEFRFDSPQLGPFRYNVGAYYSHNASDPSQVVGTNAIGSPLLLGAYVFAVQWQAAVFGSATYTLADRIDFTAGVRVSKDVVHFETTEDGFLGSGVTTGGKEVDKPVTPRVAITYRQTTDQTWYVQAAKGYRIGGPNVTAGNTPQASYAPDSLWNYELGSKSRLMDGRLTSDFSIYDIEWNNIQVGLVTPAGFNYIGNGGKARIYGVEEQLAFKAMPWLEFGGTVSLDKARTTSAASISRVSVGTGEPDAALTNGVVPGYRLPGSPEVQGSIYGEADFHVATLPSYVRISGQYVGDAYTDFDDNGLKFGVYTIGNIRAGVKLPHVEVIAFVNNFTNSYGLASALDASSFNVSTGYRIQPRTFGLTLRAGF